MRLALALAFGLCVTLAAPPALADWNVGDPAKWVQLPDLSPEGIDVNSSRQYRLADDFLCQESGPITDIHLWGSWLNDFLPPGGTPASVRFILGIHADIPADPPNFHSRPGALLWERIYDPDTYAARIWAQDLQEGWMNPPEQYIFPGDTICWQYNFKVPEPEAFVQQGTPQVPVVYWLSVRAEPIDADAWFGWKTSPDHWNDDAVWPDPLGNWQELRYPQMHPQAGRSIDLAFVIASPQPEPQLDFGDAPDSYRTLLGSDGARHGYNPDLFLGSAIDLEPDGQPSLGAVGDDLGGIDDEDGVLFTSPLVPGNTVTLTVVASIPSRLDAWLDYTLDGTWADDPGEKIFNAQPMNIGANNLSFTLPAGIGPGSTYARFRLSFAGGLSYFGFVQNGEVEDYAVEITRPEYDFGDAQDPTFPTLLANNGARHLINPNVFLGAGIDSELDGQPSALADGDDLGGFDDEDGVVFITPVVPGEPARVEVTASVDAFLDGWFDFDGDGAWTAANEQIFAAQPIVAGLNSLVFNVPVTAVPGRKFVRFRMSFEAGLPFDGEAREGEVEDYLIRVEALDYGDAPDPAFRTLFVNDGARHVITPNLRMGATIDPEPDGQPSFLADGDDNDVLGDDEDGVVFTSPLIQGQPATLDVTVNAPCNMDAWMDLDQDGTFSSPGDQIFASFPLIPGVNNLSFGVPAAAALGDTYARFRVTGSGLILAPYGLSPDGEVEDYRVRIEMEQPPQLKWEQPPDFSPEGIDVNSTRPFTLADDFLCTQAGPITEIWVWASWRNDVLPFQDAPDQVDFSLSLHLDIPAEQNPDGYSKPGVQVWGWNFSPGDFTVLPYATDLEEGWMDPPADYVFPGDRNIWLYKFQLPQSQWFYQGGDPTAPVIYWLDVNAIPLDSEAFLGWKTSDQHWNDDAVWRVDGPTGVGPWRELRYPPTHPQEGLSIDLAFALWSEDVPPPELDFGDAPENPTGGPGFPTTLVNNGARHIINPNLFLGASVDSELDGQPDAAATGDDLDGNDDEDGVTWTTPLYSGQSASVDVVASAAGHLDMWIDYDGDGTWNQVDNQVFGALPLSPGTNNLSFNVPAAAIPGLSFARFRFTSTGGFPFDGPAPDGEVEDHAVGIEQGLSNIGDRVWDDLNANGIQEPGEPGLGGVTVELIPCAGGPPVDTTTTAADGSYGFTTSPGDWFIRFRLPTGYVFSPQDQGADDAIDSDADPTTGETVCTTLDPGEVDLTWDAGMHVPPPDLDFGDAPDPTYPTLLASNGARHVITPNLVMGATIDADLDGQPSAAADGDDLLDGNDDEDGVVFTSPLVIGSVATVSVTVNAPSLLDAWIDMDGDGTWTSAIDQIFASTTLNPGINNLSFVVPGSGTPNVTYARFRVSFGGGLAPDGPAPDGEVEDYLVRIEEPPQPFKWEQPPDLTPRGIDINASGEFVLADDFECTVTGPITEVSIWGSWRGDFLPFQDAPDQVEFFLSLHADIPASQNPDGYSTPGELLWERRFIPGEFAVELYAQDLEEGWMDPPGDYIFPGDRQVWLYTFQIPEAEAFRQIGTPDMPVVYWLDLSAEPLDPAARFGWKTSFLHWNDDAVWGFGPEPYPGPWRELRYPFGHPQQGESIDLAFRLLGSEEPVQWDFGDAPDPTYETLLASNGARHVFDPAIFIGNLIDPEPDGQPTNAADGDDVLDSIDDEDGVTFLTPLRPGDDPDIDVVASVPGYLNAWIDMDVDGTWSQADEHVIIDEFLNPGLNTIKFILPTTGGDAFTTYMRFRFSRVQGLTWFGPAPNGEVEDYEVFVNEDGTDVPEPKTPERLDLRPNYPNPFNPQTTIAYDLDRDGHVVLAIYDIQGALVRTLVDGTKSADRHEVKWDGRDEGGESVASGVYLLLLKSHGEVRSAKIALIR